ncbi:hypothetical protein GJR96_05735 [Haloferax sp. MBLA0076]|uniref:DUF8123 domain-containing protein n=1 Tax=Haloferax litoreum TaxID=2666140 RepID=A0A6A8GH49_9EURY|nr:MULTISPECIES: hypothetical protein [Haloferax]KAB1192969.1 hypothetical protein Hfx1148_05730 [Haloferax sp. CBA1148]MRX21457.1 hypothetical protein [Haloferax litoreum]
MIRETTAGLVMWGVVAVGLFVALAGVATLVGMPWRYTAMGVVGIALQMFGSVVAVGIGAGLAWLGVTSGREKR